MNTRPQGTGPGRVCVLPGDTTWITGVRYLGDDVLAAIADAATLTWIADTVPREPPACGVCLLAVPARRLDALWDVQTVLRRARGGEPDCAELLDLARQLGADLCRPPRTVGDFTTGLERVLAVLTLDIPAVTTIAATLLLENAGDDAAFDTDAAHDAYTRIAVAWQDAGVPH